MRDATVCQLGLLAGLLSGLFLGCGDVAANPIVAFGGAAPTTGGMGAGGTAGGDGARGGGATGGAFTPPKILGLCDPCSDSVTCGDAGDYCVRINVGEGNDLTGERFCARDCDEDGDCPAHYGCNLTDRNIAQCAPQTNGCAHRLGVPAPPSIGAMREILFTHLTAVRESLRLPPLNEDPALDEVAEMSAVEYARGGVRFSKFDRECRDKMSECAAGWAAEQQFQITEYGLVWSAALMTAAMRSRESLGTSGTGTVDIASSTYTRLGIGVIVAGDEAFISLVYGP